MPESGPGRLLFPSLRAKLRQGRPVCGIFISHYCPEIVEIAGLCGWDFAIIDCEHAPTPSAALFGLVRAGAVAGMPVVVRVASNDPALIQHALDAGAAGVQIPQISSEEGARVAVTAARFQPLGQRGFGPFVRAADYGALETESFFTRARDETALILQVESRQGLEAVDRIIAVDGIDVLFLGPYDMSQSLGVPGQTAHPLVVQAVETLAAKASRKGIDIGIFARTEEDARRWVGLGVRYLSYSSDTLAVEEGMRQALRQSRAACAAVSDARKA